MRPQIKLMLDVKATDNKLRTGIDAEISIAKLTGYALTRYFVSKSSPNYLKLVEWCACKLVEIGVVDPVAAEEAYKKQEDKFVSLHMANYNQMRSNRLRKHRYGNEIVNTYVRSRFNFYKHRLPEDVARAQARHEFGKLIIRLAKQKIPRHIIATRFGVTVERVRQAEATALRKNRHRSPIIRYFEYRDFL